jgi:glycine/D-amino acid oxidase-like deaminating enzyme
MRPDILIIGQGLAGTLLAWEFERAGFSFVIADVGHAAAATNVAAGIINPITGRRLVKSWRVEALLPAARATCRALEDALGVPLWHELRIRRIFADERERRVFGEKYAEGGLAPFAGPADEAGFWIEGAARVELRALLAAARARWSGQGRLRPAAVASLAEEVSRFGLVVDCTGSAGARGGGFGFVPWEFSKGEILALAVDGLSPGVALNRGHWVVPVGPGAAWVGATHEPGFADLAPTPAARARLEASAAALLGRPFAVTAHVAGVRVNLPDKRPVAGRHPRELRLGALNGLGSKGALWAPLLARQWVNHLAEGVPFDAEVEIGRFWDRPAAPASSR